MLVSYMMMVGAYPPRLRRSASCGHLKDVDRPGGLVFRRLDVVSARLCYPASEDFGETLAAKQAI